MRKSCVPPELKALADQAQARKDAAIERLRAAATELGALEEVAEGDPFMQEMKAIIEADKKVVQMRRRA